MDENNDWCEVYETASAHYKSSILQTMLCEKFKELFPEKPHKISSTDQPWIIDKLKTMNRKRKS